MDRRAVITGGIAAGTYLGLGSIPAAAQQGAGQTRIVGISCSPRRGMTTATSVQVALAAAEEHDPRIETHFIDLAGLKMYGWEPEETKAEREEPTDFQRYVEPALRSPNLGGIVIGSPVYYRAVTALCKAFLEETAVLRSPQMLLANIPVGALAVGSARNGGQELTIEQIHVAMLCHECIIVGGESPAFQGATLWNAHNDDIMRDKSGIESARKLGRQVARTALSVAI